MKVNLKISIAMATYNGEKYLQQQLESFLHQTRLPDELVICDDNSSDLTLKIIESFSGRAPFPVHVHCNSQNMGYLKTFERAITLSKGDIIFLSDQDDVWFPEKIEYILNAFQDIKSPLVVINDAIITDESLRPVKRTLLQQIFSARLPIETFISGCCTAFRKELKVVLLPFPQEYGGHDDWIHRIGIALGRRKVITCPLQYYRRSAGATSHYFTNQPKRVTVIDRALFYMRGNPKEACLKRLELLDILVARLIERGPVLEKALDETLELDEIIKRVREEQHAVEKRLMLLQKPRFRRIPMAYRMLRTKEYKYFSGWMSFIRDVLW